MHTELVDLLVLDSRMPNIDGWEFCQMMEADESLGSIPVILTSARTLLRRRIIQTLTIAGKKHKQAVTKALANLLDGEDNLVCISALRLLAYLADLQSLEPLRKLANSRTVSLPPRDFGYHQTGKLTRPAQWDAETCVAWWTGWAIERIEAVHK